jgi:hypothetical protein
MPNSRPAATRITTTASARALAHSRADEVSHNFAIVHQHVEKQQCWRHGQDCDDVDQQHDIDQGDAGDQDQAGGGGGFENQDQIERFSLLEGKIQAVRTVSDFSEGVGGGS